ncbi:hypothetical protein DL768_005289 [Monosporascus sp. mg162]|nr:hypothetical protein DL768_005289 [Monosporascus sp. mg162]
MSLENRAGSCEPDPREFSRLSEQDFRAGYRPAGAISTCLHSSDDRLAASSEPSEHDPMSRWLHSSDEPLSALLAGPGPGPPLPERAHGKDPMEYMAAWDMTWQSASRGSRARPKARAKNSPKENATVPAAERESLGLPDTSPSEAQRQGPRRLTAAEKSRLVEAVRNCLRVRISGVLGATTRGAAGGEQSNPRSTVPQTSAVPSSQQHTNGTGKRKGKQRGEGPGDDSDANGLEKRHKSYPEPSPGVIRDKFACPCFKRDPQLYGPESDCASHSWDIRRLKDGERPAQLARQKYGRIMDTQLFKGKSDHAKWLAIFEILYPEVPREEYPSPYHDHNSVENFLHFALQQTSLHLPAELGQHVFVMGSEDARDRVTEVVRVFLRSVYDNYRDSQRLTSSTTLHAPNSLTLGPADHLSGGQAAPETTVDHIAPGVQDYVEAFLPSGFADEEIARALRGETDPFSWNPEEEA